jgi:hypothetical protein
VDDRTSGASHNPYPLLDWINSADSLTCRFLWTTESVYKCRRKVRPAMAYLLDDDARATEVLDTAKRSLRIGLAL